jgi:hypothetical protein
MWTGVTYARETEADEADEDDLRPRVGVEAHQLGGVSLARKLVDMLLLRDTGVCVLEISRMSAAHGLLRGLVRGHGYQGC